MSVMPSGTLYINFKKRPYTKRTLTEENSRCVFDKRIRKLEVVGHRSRLCVLAGGARPRFNL